MSESFQNEVPKARINLKLDLHTGGAQKKVELPLKLLVMGDYSNGQDTRALAERAKVDINKNNFNALVEVLQQAMDAQGIAFTAQNKLLAKLAPMHRDIINTP